MPYISLMKALIINIFLENERLEEELFSLYIIMFLFIIIKNHLVGWKICLFIKLLLLLLYVYIFLKKKKEKRETIIKIKKRYRIICYSLYFIFFYAFFALSLLVCQIYIYLFFKIYKESSFFIIIKVMPRFFFSFFF